MSLAELLPAIRALPKPEQVELLHLLIDGVAEPPPTATNADDGITDEIRRMFPPGYVAEVWFPGANPEGAAAAMQVLREFEAGRE